MANRKKKHSATTTSLDLKIGRMVRRLRDFFETGRAANRKAATKGTPPRATDLATEFGVDYETLRRAREFAKRYTTGELNALCRLRRAPRGLPFSLGYIPFLLMVPWQTASARDARAKLAREAAQEGWTIPELADEIERRYPDQRRQTKSGEVGGRKRTRPPSDAALLRRIATRSAEASRWCGWISECVPSAKISRAAKIELQKRLSDAMTSLNAMEAVAAKAVTQIAGVSQRPKSNRAAPR
jgi:hypothetical protein